jgi:hypothetical protein
MISDKPDIPRHFILAKQLGTESSFTVAWTPGNDNGHQQTFILKYKKVSDDEWNTVTVSDTREYEMTYTVTGLSSGTYYEIVLYASNMLGNSEESEIILAKTKGQLVLSSRDKLKLFLPCLNVMYVSVRPSVVPFYSPIYWG